MMHSQFCGTSRAVSLFHLFLPKIGLLLLQMSQNGALKSDFQHPFKWKVQLPTGPGNIHEDLQGPGITHLSGWEDTIAFLPLLEEFKKCRLLPRPPEDTNMRHSDPVTVTLTQRVRDQLIKSGPCLGSCLYTCQRPAQPKEGERIKKRISFLFSCKKYLPSGYKCYCVCVALCCPQLASITGSQWQYFYNPWSIAYFYGPVPAANPFCIMWGVDFAALPPYMLWM
jgi:hypothetical protein